MTDNDSTRALNQQDRTILSFGEAGRAALAKIDSLVIQRDAAEALVREAEARETALGLQVVAQAARLRLADALAGAVRQLCEDWPDTPRAYTVTRAETALAAWDAVPGDVGGEP